MSEAKRAVRSHEEGVRIPLTLVSVNRRVDDVEDKLDRTHALLVEVVALVGAPGVKADGGDATGLYDLIGSVGRRLRPFEKWAYQFKGAVMVGGPMLLGFGTLLWFMNGDKISALFAG